MSVLEHIRHNAAAGVKMLAVLLDPAKPVDLQRVAALIAQSGVSLVLIGGSGYTEPVDSYLLRLRQCLADSDARSCHILLFPGDICQFSPEADALLFLSLLSCRDAELLVGKHISVARRVQESGIETIPMGYILVDGGSVSTVQQVTAAQPLSDADAVVSTAVAGVLLGKQLIYLEAGSGAAVSVSPDIISAVRSRISVPLLVGGGVRTTGQLTAAFQAGADIVVVGNWFESHPEDIPLFADAAKTVTSPMKDERNMNGT